MKKLLLLCLSLAIIALPVMAQTTKNPTVIINKDCAKTAVQKREQSLIMAYTQHQGAFNNALMNRQTALYNAWNIDDVKARKTAINTARAKFTQAKKAANKTLLNKIQTTWKSYRADMAKCKINPADYESKTAESSDTNIQN